MGTPIRLVAKVTGQLDELKVKHYFGFPPELTGGEDRRQLREPAALVVLGQEKDGVFLTRYTANGKEVGDTWHMTVEDAKHQAQYEYGDLLTNWIEVPADIEDAVSFGLNAKA